MPPITRSTSCRAVRGCLNTRERLVERGVSYVRGNALKGRRFNSLAEENSFLSQWEQNVADKRIHGTTGKQVAARFEEERPHLQALPASLFPCYQEARRNVSRDSFVEVKRAFYEAPPEYIGRQVWARWDSRCVRIFNERMEQVQIHARLEPGKFSRILGAVGMSAPVVSSCRWWIERAALLGEACGRWAQASVDRRGPEGCDPSWDFAIWLKSTRPPLSTLLVRRL